MRILIIHPRFDIYGGAEYLIVKLANYLSKNHNVSILTWTMLPEIEKKFIDTEIYTVPSTKLREWLHKYSDLYDIINSHNHPCELLLYPKSKPHVWMLNEPPEIVLIGGKLPIKERDIVRESVDRIVVVDEYNANRCKKIYGVTPIINHYGIDYDFFSKKGTYDIKSEYNLENKFIIVQTGWFNSFKNQLESVKTIGKLIDEIPNIKLLLIGTNKTPYRKTVLNYIRKNNLESYVSIIGHVSREKVRDFYHISNIALFPIHTQGGWLSPFESISSNLPIIISPDAPCSNLIRKHDLGIVTRRYDKAILDLYNHPIKLDYASEWVRDNLTWGRFSKKIEDIFLEVIK